MSRSDFFLGFSGALMASLWLSAGCSSSEPSTDPEGDAGAGTAQGGSAAAGRGNGGRAGKGGGSAGSRAGSDPGDHAGAGAEAGAAPTAGTGATVGEQGGAAGSGASASAGSGPEVDGGSGGASDYECSPSNDHCPAGRYCSTANTCVAGCKNGDSCASGVCGSDHECQNCISDLECSEPHVCGAAQCASACSAEQEGSDQGCGSGLTCCSLHCVATTNDQQHCGTCGTACSDAQFCGQSGCLGVQFSELCQIGKIAVILDGQDGDDPTGRAMAQSLVDHCTSPQTKREVSQTASDALNSINGRPVSGSDELLVVAGGPYFQHAADYLVKNAVAPIGSRATQTTFELYDTKTGALVASEPISSVSDSHGLFAVQFVREPSSSSLILNAYGFTIGGTAAATFYVAQVLAPNLAAASKAWYVGEWVDANADLKPAANELTILASGK